MLKKELLEKLKITYPGEWNLACFEKEDEEVNKSPVLFGCEIDGLNFGVSICGDLRISHINIESLDKLFEFINKLKNKDELDNVKQINRNLHVLCGNAENKYIQSKAINDFSERIILKAIKGE